MAHTPGPWHRNIAPATKYPTVFVGRNRHIFDLIHARCVTPEEAEANHNLAIAAPDLLAACEAALAALDDMTTEQFSRGADKPQRDAMRAAIAKARRT